MGEQGDEEDEDEGVLVSEHDQEGCKDGVTRWCLGLVCYSSA